MLLSKQQQYILDVLHRLGCARTDQMERLLQTRFFPEEKSLPPGYADTLLRQMALCGAPVTRTGDVAVMDGRKADAHLLEAIDVMLELTQAAPSEYWAIPGSDVLLRFSVEGEQLSLFAVLHADRLQRIPPQTICPEERLVILLSREGPLPRLPLPNPHFYTLRRPDGSHRFFVEEITTSKGD